MRLNLFAPRASATFEGAPAVELTLEQRLRRSVLACLLWEDEFYEDGQSIAERILALGAEGPPQVLADVAGEARERFKRRRAPLLLVTALVKTGRGTPLVADTIERVIQRAD